MRKSTIEILIPASKRLLWDIVTDNNNTAWRSDLSRVEIVNDLEFIEYTTGGISTKFAITNKIEYEYYEFSFGNKNMSGLWYGKFIEVDKNVTRLEFTEEIKFCNPVVELISYIFFPIKSNQKKYMRDLRIEAEQRLNLFS